jgi:hypothetical protein
MPVTIEREDDRVYRLDITGALHKADLDRVQRMLLDDIGRDSDVAVKLLVVLDDFNGWEPDASWNDLTFYVRHGDRLGRIAIVGDERWRDHALMFAAADLRKGPVEFFASEKLPQAREWLLQ